MTKKVNLFIVGAAKAGTTSFHDYLDQHPDVCMSSIKEPNYFSQDQISDLYYRQASLINDETSYYNLFDKGNSKNTHIVYGESSVSYLSYPEIPKKLYKYNSNARILIFLRNPIERAFSHYLMDYTAGYFDFSFEEILKFKESNALVYKQVIELSFYYSQIKEYLETFPKNQVKFIIMEDATKNLNKTIHEIESFLDLKTYNNYDFKVKNSFKNPPNKFINKIYRSQGFKNIAKRVISKKISDTIKNRLFKTKKPKIDLTSKAYLSQLFLNDVSQLSQLIGIDLNQFWKINKIK